MRLGHLTLYQIRERSGRLPKQVFWRTRRDDGSVRAPGQKSNAVIRKKCPAILIPAGRLKKPSINQSSRSFSILALFLLTLALPSCETLQFYSQGLQGQVEILQKSRLNQEVLADPSTPNSLRQRLLLTKEICDFASQELDLPGDSAYHKYADLGREHVVYVLYAAPEFSIEPKTWSYPIVGDLDYRGYFNKDEAKAYAEKLQTEGYDVHLGGTDAYSTLGFFHDPVLNTFADYPETNYIETIFHELTHRKIFVSGETTFNESLANTVAEEGMRRWFISKGKFATLADYEERLIRRRDFYSRIAQTRDELKLLYTSDLSPPEMRLHKKRLMADLKIRARALQQRWGNRQLEAWLQQDLTNAHLLALVTYNEKIPFFKKLLEQSNGDFKAFFQRVEDLK